MQICIFTCSACQNPSPNIIIYVTKLQGSALQVSLLLSGAKLSTAEHNSPFVLG